MASNISNILNNRLRLSGMASGLDTESMIKQLMKAEQYKVDKVKQEKQLLQWKRDDYRNVTTMLKGFNDTYMDVLSSSNMRSQNSYKAFTVNSSNTTVANVTANADAIAGAHKIAVTKLASAASTSSGSGVSAALGSTSPIANFNFTSGKDFNITLNGVTKNIKLTDDFTGATALNDLRDELAQQINAAFGTGKVAVGVAGGGLTFSSADSKIVLSSGSDNALLDLEIASGASNRLNLSSKLNNINMAAPLPAEVEFIINGVSFSFDSTTKTMKDVLNEVNSSSAGVTLSYSEATDKFTLTSKVKGAGNSIVIEQEDEMGNPIEDLSFLGISVTSVNNGQDAEIIYDGTKITRNDNNFTLDGIKFNLLKVSDVDIDDVDGYQKTTISIEQDVDKVFNNIISFVDKYNELVSKITAELGETRDRDYQPLTDEQKESMSESDIKTWEAKASAGMLRNDSLLSGILNEMRSAIYNSINGVSGGVYSIGIKTGDYTQRGKLIVEEAKLKDAIKNKPDLVASVFNKESEIKYSTKLDQTSKTIRYKESGIVNRLYDIIQSNITLVSNDKGKKGLLIEKAGYLGDYVDTSSIVSKQIKEKETQIYTLVEKLYDKEDRYYRKFAAMEKAMSQMNNQSSWLSQQFGGQ